MPGSLYIIPSFIGTPEPSDVSILSPVIGDLRTYVVENEKTARAFLKHFSLPCALQAIQMSRLDEHTKDQSLSSLLSPLMNGEHIGLLSEAGYPSIADPGSRLVLAAHQAGISVVPMVGASAIFLAIVASGLNGQRFSFRGYLPSKGEERNLALKKVESESRHNSEAIFFIETPYRAQSLFEAINKVCAKNTLLSVAANLRNPNQILQTNTIKNWANRSLDLADKLVVFGLEAAI